MNRAKNFISDLFKYTPSQFVPAFAGLASILILTTRFSPAEYKQFVPVIAIISVHTAMN